MRHLRLFGQGFADLSRLAVIRFDIVSGVAQTRHRRAVFAWMQVREVPCGVCCACS
jgi:hypothetical protein